MARSIYFKFRDGNINDDVRLQFGEYALIMYYAKQLDETKAKKLFDATLTEYKFRISNDLPLEGTDIDILAHYNPDDLLEAVSFIDQQLVPALSTEPVDLLQKYDGPENFVRLYEEEEDTFLDGLTLYDDELYEKDPKHLAYMLERLKNLLQQSINTGVAMESIIEF